MINITSSHLDQVVNASLDTFSTWSPVFSLVIIGLISCVVIFVVKNILKR